MSISDATTLPFLDTANERFLTDPHATFDRLRHLAVVADGNGVSLLDYATCDAAFHDTALVPGIDWLLQDLGHGPLWGTFDHTLTDAEGDDHQRLRRAVSPWFTARRIDGLRERTRQLVDGLLDPHVDADSLEVMEDLADQVPSALFCWMVGADPADAALLARWSKSLLLVFTAQASMVGPVKAAKAELLEYTEKLLELKRRQPADDLASALVKATDSGVIDTLDAACLLEELLSASVDNTANTIGTALHTLATHPEQWTLVHRQLHDRLDGGLSGDRTLLANTIEECGRFQPAIRHTIKYATAATDLLGHPITRGTYVTIRIAAAHRDPTVYLDPHRFEAARKLTKPQLAFGAGRHYCLGAALGKMELQEAVGGVVSRWSGAVVGDGAIMNITASGHVARLPLELTR